MPGQHEVPEGEIVGDDPAADAGAPGGIAGSLAAGARVGGYRLEQPLGRGGMAAVYLARDDRLDRLVALKILAPELAADEGFRTRFIRESRAAAAVDHPHIIPVFDAGEAGGMLYITMRYVPGGDVGTMVRREGPLSPGRVAAVIAQVASALDAAHAAGLVHRDVKPANMLVDVRSGRSEHVYLADFGLSKKTLAVSAGLTGTGQFLGTLDYVAPEQIQGRPADGRTDQYGLGCAAFELLTGAPPFPREEAAAVMYAHLSDPPPPVTSRRPGLPPGLDPVLARALAKAPASRYSSCQEFADALLHALGTAPPTIRRTKMPTSRRCRRQPMRPGTHTTSVSPRMVDSGPCLRRQHNQLLRRSVPRRSRRRQCVTWKIPQRPWARWLEARPTAPPP
jgi:serine/threonine-protein kinase